MGAEDHILLVTAHQLVADRPRYRLGEVASGSECCGKDFLDGLLG